MCLMLYILNIKQLINFNCFYFLKTVAIVTNMIYNKTYQQDITEKKQKKVGTKNERFIKDIREIQKRL